MKNISIILLVSISLLFVGCAQKQQTILDTNTGVFHPQSITGQEHTGSVVNDMLQSQYDKLLQEKNSLMTQLQSLQSGNDALVGENDRLKMQMEKYKEALLQQKNMKTTEQTKPQSTSSEELHQSQGENRNKTPAEIKKIYTKDGKTYFSIDILSINPDFQPGITNYYINKSFKLREVYVSNSIIAIPCEVGVGQFEMSVQQLIEEMKTSLSQGPVLISTFDIINNEIKTIYPNCGP